LTNVRLGHGILETALVGRHTTILRAFASNPLKLLCPRRNGKVAWVYACTYGGGLVAGDAIDLDIRVGPGSGCVLGTQASTKVYKSPTGRVSHQGILAEVAEGALLVSAPDPVVCFAGSVYEQRQHFDVADGGNLVLVDWLTSGRYARNECWAFSHYRSCIDIFYGQRLVFQDSLMLDPKDGPLRSPYRLGRFHCLAVMVLVGAEMQQACDGLLNEVSRQPTGRQCSYVDAVSPIPHGAVFRVLGTSTESVAQTLRDKLHFLHERLGDAPWSRKW
jgi:urease accessory protein